MQGKKAPGSGMNLYGDNRRNAQDVDEISSLFKFVVLTTQHNYLIIGQSLTVCIG